MVDIPSLAEEFKPRVYFHKEEKYFPTTIEGYLKYTQMYQTQEGSTTPQKDDPVVSSDPLSLLFPSTEHNLKDFIVNDDRNYLKPINYKYINKPSGELVDLVDGKYRSSFFGNPALTETPFYVVAHKDVNDPEAQYLSYTFFYAYNGAAHLLFDLIKIEDHFCDICHITVHVKKIGGEYKLLDVYYSAHSGGELVKEVKTVGDNGKNPIVYAAINSHASYTKRGVYFRILGFGNDVTQEELEWSPDVEIMAIDGVGQGDYKTFYSYLGNMGFKGSLPFLEDTGDTSVGSIGTKDWSGNNGRPEEVKKEGFFISTFAWYLLLITTQISSLVLLGFGFHRRLFDRYKIILAAMLMFILLYTMLLTKYEFTTFILILASFVLLMMYLGCRFRK